MKRVLPLLLANIGHHRRLLVEQHGADEVGFLERTGLLRSEGPADWWPCGRPGEVGDGCPRAIVESGREDAPLLAVCGEGMCCEDVPLHEADRELLAGSLPRFFEMLERLLQAEGSDRSERYPNTAYLGVTRRDGSLREIHFAHTRQFPSILMLLIAMRQVAPLPTLILVRSLQQVPAAMLASCGPHQQVDLVALDEVLARQDGKIALHWPRPTAVASSSPRTTYVVHSHEGEKRLSADAYAALLAVAPETFDLFIDTATLVEGARKGRCKAGVLVDGEWKEAFMAQDQAEALAELMRRRPAYLMPRELAVYADRGAGDARALVNRLQLARAMIDQAPWRWFPTQPGSKDRDLAYRFQPAMGARWAVITRSA